MINDTLNKHSKSNINTGSTNSFINEYSPSYQLKPQITSKESNQNRLALYSHLRKEFNDADLEQGMDEFKERTRGQLSNKNAEKNFLRLISGDINEHVQMARELDFKTPENGATFYSGPIAKKKAWQHAISIGSKAIEQTPGGNTFETWPWFNKKAFPENKWGTKGRDDQSIVWSALSQVYAENAHGQAEVFQEYEGNIWKGYEKPTLTKRGIPYIVHKVSSNNA